MTDPKHEPVSYRWTEGEYGEWKFANSARDDWPVLDDFEPLYSACTVEALKAERDALKEENERLNAPAPRAEMVGLKVGDLVLTHTGEAGRIDYEDKKHTKRWHVLISPQYGGMYFDFELTKLVPATPSPETNVLTQPPLPESGESVEGGE